MLAAVAGGNLQGVEVVYLARKAGWDVLLLDRDVNAPASGLCERFVRLDLCDADRLAESLADVDFLIPALEDDEALISLANVSQKIGVPFGFDPQAYAVSSSKIASDRFFEHVGIPIPEPWPKCRLPVVAKPSRASGSADIRIFHRKKALDAFLSNIDGGWVIQSYIDGPTYSLEVVGSRGCYQTLQVTDLYMDRVYDCKGVSAPSRLPSKLQKRFEDIGLEIAKQLDLKGLMDVEVVLDKDDVRVLEIDARFPSQTPTAVYHSSGYNMLAALGGLFLTGEPVPEVDLVRPDSILYEHIRVSGADIQFAGEHIMSKAGPLRLIEDFFGADEAITNYQSGRSEWVATLMITGERYADVEHKRQQVMDNLRRGMA